MERRRTFGVTLAAAMFGLAGCSLVPRTVPAEAPPLADMEEPLELAAEPQDEAERAALPAGGFSGIELAEVRATLEEMLEAIPGLEVARVVENSPADVAGVRAGDRLVSVERDGTARELAWPSQWRAVELETPPGTALRVELEREGVRLEFQLMVVARARPAAREPVERWREEERAGVVFRSTSEVEARAAGLAPGAGAIVAGLSRASPWRSAGVRFGDLVVAADGRPVAHPAALVAAVRGAGDAVDLELRRGGTTVELRAPLTRRATEVSEFSIPLLYDYENDRGHTTTSILFGLYKFERTRVAWRMRLLWFIVFAGGEADRLEELGRSEEEP